MNRQQRRAAARKTQPVSNGLGAASPAAASEADHLHLQAGMPTAERLSKLGTILRQQGQRDEALRAFDAAIALKPDHAEPWRQRSDIVLELGRTRDALLSYQRVLELDRHDWNAACRSGILLYQAGRLEDALAHFNLCDALRPNHAPTLYMRAVFLRGLQRFEEALVDNRRAHALDPANADTCNNTGAVLQALGRHDESLQWFDRAIALRPTFGEALFNKALSLWQLNRRDDALAVYDSLKALGPKGAVADWNLAVLLHELGRYEDALAHFNQSNRQRPDHAPTLHMRALTLHRLRRYEEALADNRRAHALDPTDADTCNNLGNTLRLLDRDDEALEWLDRALALRPDFVKALTNKASVLGELRRFDEAFAIHERLKDLDPGNPTTRLALANLQLLTGDFEAGWRGREARWSVPGFPIARPGFAQPVWLGDEPIDGKTILIYSDEGLGDAIQFARYMPVLAGNGARVILLVGGPLQALLSGVPGVSLCLPKSTPTLPAFDVYCPMTSLPLALQTRLETIPPATYLPPAAADRAQAWEERLGARQRLRVGLVWSGNPNHVNDQNRSIPLQLLTRILDADASFFSLQKDPKPADKAVLSGRADILDLTSHLTDFTETAALVSCLDLIITVDTSVAHLAGTLGCPTWILLPYAPDCRWLLDRDDSPWYPTVRLFRQSESRDYTSVVDRVRTDLQAQVAAFRGRGR